MKKIETDNISYRNQTISFCEGVKVRFNGIGQAEVSDEDYDKLIKDFDGFIFDAGKSPKKEVVEQKFDDTEAKAEIEKLNNVISVRDDKIKDLENKLQVEVDSANVWKENYDKLKSESIDETSKVEIEQLKENITKLETKCLLLGKPRKELVETAVSLKLDEKEYKNLNNQELVEYLITKL